MSELVEKVARAMTLSMNADPDQVIDGVIVWHHFIPDARAAIKAVAEWGQSNFYSDKPLEEFLDELLAQLEAKT